MKEFTQNKDSILGAIITGFLAVLSYLSWSVLSLPKTLNTLLHFFFGVFLIMAFIGIYYTFRSNKNYLLKSSAVFGMSAGLCFMLMTVVQHSNIEILSSYVEKTNGTNKQIWSMIWRGVSSVQLGLDICWDIFITLATILLGITLLKYRRLITIIGIIGITVGLLTLVLNLYTFPIPPAESDLFDAGPFVGTWYLVLCGLMFTMYRKEKSELRT